MAGDDGGCGCWTWSPQSMLFEAVAHGATAAKPEAVAVPAARRLGRSDAAEEQAGGCDLSRTCSSAADAPQRARASASKSKSDVISASPAAE
jgi:hypothetical protein